MMPCVVVAGVALQAGCRRAGPLSTLQPAAQGADAIATLWWWLFGGAALIVVLVGTLLAIGFRRQPTATSDDAGARWTQGWGLGFGVPVVVAALVAGIALGERLLPHGQADATIDAVASQWRWEFSVAGRGAPPVSENVLHIPAGVPVDVRVHSSDVIHSLWIPRLSGKLDAIPGHVNTLRLENVQPGEYEAVCAEYCGTGHRGHRFRVVAHDATQWRRHLAMGAP